MCSGLPDEDPLQTVCKAAERLRHRPAAGRGTGLAAAELVRIRHAIDLMEVEFAARAAEFASTDEYDHAGYVSPIGWIREECRTSGHVAATAICVGQQIDNLPHTAAAVAAKRIGFGHLALMASTARAIEESPTAGAFDEGVLLRKALKHTVSRFRHDCAHARHEADARAYLAEHVEEVGWRRLELVPCESGAVVIKGFLDSLAGAAVRTALEPLARRNGVGDDRPVQRRMADALLELATHGLDSGVLPTHATVRPHLQVTVALETVQGAAGAAAGEVEWASPIAATSVQRLACDASVRRIVLDADSAVLDVGRARRVPSAATRRALALRDGGCVWPGCDRPVSWTSAHHLRHWSQGGPTEVQNLVLLCHRHHWLTHEGGWTLLKSETEGVIALPPLSRYAPRARPPGASAA